MLRSDGCSSGNCRWQVPNCSHFRQGLGLDGKSGPCTSHLVAPSHSLSLVSSTFPTILLPAPSAWLIRFLACLASGHCLSPCASLPWLRCPASGSQPSPLLSFVEAAPLGHEAWGGAVAIGGRELHAGRGDRRGGREFSQTHSQPGDRGKVERTTDREQGQRVTGAGGGPCQDRLRLRQASEKQTLGLNVRGWLALPQTHCHSLRALGAHQARCPYLLAPVLSAARSPCTVERGSPHPRIPLPLPEFLLSEHVRNRRRKTRAGARDGAGAEVYGPGFSLGASPVSTANGLAHLTSAVCTAPGLAEGLPLHRPQKILPDSGGWGFDPESPAPFMASHLRPNPGRRSQNVETSGSTPETLGVTHLPIPYPSGCLAPGGRPGPSGTRIQAAVL